ncbi:hypothetical protein [Candidatus Poriferisocius sp.]|uniref:hypothetical protein n=1 Tax=Candidatus Poriferisocius sp. TaxID=3101276 RepID=UPI003B020BFA
MTTPHHPTPDNTASPTTSTEDVASAASTQYKITINDLRAFEWILAILIVGFPLELVDVVEASKPIELILQFLLFCISLALMLQVFVLFHRCFSKYRRRVRVRDDQVGRSL